MTEEINFETLIDWIEEAYAIEVDNEYITYPSIDVDMGIIELFRDTSDDTAIDKDDITAVDIDGGVATVIASGNEYQLKHLYLGEKATHVSYVWGPEQADATCRSFRTNAEAIAYCSGIEDQDGWYSSKLVDGCPECEDSNAKWEFIKDNNDSYTKAKCLSCEKTTDIDHF